MSVNPVRCGVLAALLIVLPAVPSRALASPRADRTEALIVRAMNEVRASHHLPKLRISRNLLRAADAQSARMAAGGAFSHGAFNARVRHYVRSRMVGENLAWMQSCNARVVVRMWLNTSAHRRIMFMRSFRRVGVARRQSAVACYVT